jgi:hypothetical protein
MKAIRLTTHTLLALAGVALAGCAVDSEHAFQEPTANADGGAPAASMSVAERAVAQNATADKELHLVARKYLNDDTEVAEFYEPVPGQILFSATGSPKGPSVLAGTLAHAQEKTTAELWASVAPGEEMPRALTEALARAGTPPTSKLAASQTGTAPHAATSGSAPNVGGAQTAATTGATFGGEPPAAPVARFRPEGGTPPGYCTTQFWTDNKTWPSVYGPGTQIETNTYNYGWNNESFSNVTWASGFLVCPLGNVSGTGGNFTVNLPNGSSTFSVLPNYYRNLYWKTGYSCGFDTSCWGTRCSPIPFNISASYQSQCYLSHGASCGDEYDWEAWHEGAGSYCQ